MSLKSSFSRILVGLLILATPAASAPPEPIDNISKLPPGRWSFAKLLWQGTEPCTPDLCEAGYYATPLLVSVRRYNQGREASVGIRVDIQGCDTKFLDALYGPDYFTLSEPRQFERVAQAVQSLTAHASKVCNAALAEVPIEGLRPLYPSP